MCESKDGGTNQDFKWKVGFCRRLSNHHGERSSIELIKQKEILLNIEKISNKMEDVSDVVKTIIVKYA